MANYSGSPFGVPFNYNGQYPPPPPGPYSMNSQNPYPQHRLPMYGQQPPQMVHPAQYANAYNNGQYPHTLTPSNGVSHPAPPVFYGYGPYPNGPVPPPPFPPIPIPTPSYNVPQRMNVPISQVPSPSTFQPHNALPPKPVMAPPETINTELTAENSLAIESPDREDGELSELEIRTTTNGTTSAASNQSSQRLLNGDASKLGGKVVQEPGPAGAEYSKAQRTNDQDPASARKTIHDTQSSLNEQNLVFGETEESMSTARAPVFAESGKIKSHEKQPYVSSANSPVPDITKELFAKDHAPSSPLISLPQAKNDMRTKVKAALKDLQDYNIGYECLLAEGLDASILRTLYHELGIPIPSTTSTDFHVVERINSDNFLANNIVNSSPQSVQVLESSTPSITEANPISKIKSPAPRLELINTAIHQSPPGSTIPILRKENHIPDPSSPALHRVKPESANIPKKLPMTAADKALERKDYIAKMLAAKAGKSITSPVVTKMSDPEAESHDRKPTALIMEQESSHSAIKTAANGQENLEAKKSEVKNLDKTELIRQKLHALQNNGTRGAARDSMKTLQPTTQTMLDLSQPSIPEPEPSDFSPRDHTSAKTSIRESAQHQTSSYFQVVEHTVDSPLPLSQQQEEYTPLKPFFAPLTQNTVGIPGLSTSLSSIPGLFGGYSAPSVPLAPAPSIAKPSQPQPSQSLQSSTSTTPALEPELPLAKSSVTAIKESLQSTSNVLTQPSQLVESRKRAIAADFIDSSPNRAKKRLGSRDRTQLVIEVSDDEDNNEAESMEIDSSSPAMDQEASQTVNGGNKMTASRGLPLLSNIPSHTGTQTNSPKNTPPTPQAAGKAAEKKDLRQTEEQIRLLNKKIAELTERSKAKKTSSQTQTPKSTTPAQSNEAAIPVSSSLADSSVPSQVDNGKQALETTSQQLKLQNTLAAVEFAMEENLEADKRTQAIVLAKAEEERQEAVKATSQQEREFRLSRKAKLEAALPKLDDQIKMANSKLDDVRKQQAELEAEIQRGSEGRKQIVDELNILLATLEAETMETKNTLTETIERQPSVSGVGDQGHSDSVDRGPALVSTGNRSRPSSPRSFRRSISAEGTTHSSMREQQSRPQSTEEAMEMSSTDEGQIINSSRSGSPHGINDATEEDMEEYEPRFDQDSEEYEPKLDEDMDEYEPQYDRDQIPRRSPDAPIMLDSTDDEMMDTYSPESIHSVPILEDKSKSEPEHTGDRRLSIAGSLREEGEVSNSVSADDVNGLGDYESPRPDISVDNSIVSEKPASINPVLTSKYPTSYGSELGKANSENQAQVYPESLTPVPALPLKDRLNEEVVTTMSNETTYQPASSKTSNLKQGYFTPYDSPLKMFNSYRYHPEYVKDISGGYRSLTYSHKINPREPVCPWELTTGICSDLSCKYQHLKDMRLPDDKILQELGSAREGRTIDEQSTFVTGLKEKLRDMRERKLTDFQSIASEIIAYRAMVLGDSSRVLTHL